MLEEGFKKMDGPISDCELVVAFLIMALIVALVIAIGASVMWVSWQKQSKMWREQTFKEIEDRHYVEKMAQEAHYCLSQGKDPKAVMDYLKKAFRQTEAAS